MRDKYNKNKTINQWQFIWYIESPYNFGGTGPILGVKKTSVEDKWARCKSI
jgi:hypothetical protein